MIHIRIATVIVCSASLMAPIAAAAQVGKYASSSFTAAHTYESNLFATPQSLTPQGDFISQFGPSVTAGYQSLPFEFSVNYELLAERYQRHTGLNDHAARQEAGFMLRYQPRERLGMSVKADYVSTQTPAEFNVQSGLDIGRAPAERIAMASTATFNVTRATIFNAAYTFDRDVLVGRIASMTHRPRVGIASRLGVRNSYRVDYEFRQFDFSGGLPIASHALTGGWAHEFTKRLGGEVAFGPRFSAGTVKPDIATRLRWRLDGADLLLSYARTDMTAIGERGTLDVHSLSTGFSYRPVRRIKLSATPLVSRSARGRQHVMVYTLGAESTVTLKRRLSLVAIARLSRQEGTLAGPRLVIANRSLGMHLTFSTSRNDREAGAISRTRR